MPSQYGRRDFLRMLGAGAAGLAGAGAIARTIQIASAADTSTAPEGGAASKPAAKLNLVFFLVDDMGFMDVACNGSKIYQTSNIDRLAADGMRFTQGYAACPVCSPTRASILTGKYPARLHLTDWIPGHKIPNTKMLSPAWTQYLPLEEVTLAETLRSAGYVTASIGKWHLGGKPYLPESQGFDINLFGSDRGSPKTYFSPYNDPAIKDGPQGEYLTDRMTDEAEKFIETNKDKPFFLYLPHYGVHTPIQGKKDLVAKEIERGRPAKGPNNATYAAMIDSVDESLGRIMKKLKELGLEDRTVVIFMSDNGGYMPSTSNAPLREGKGWPYEGGIREPMIVRWPGVVKAGTTCDTAVSSVDFYPTMLEMAGAPDTAGHSSDGASIVPLLKQTGKLSREDIYWHYPHYNIQGGTPFGVVRSGDFKLIEFYEDGRLELYNIKDDPAEAHDLAAAEPEKLKDLHARLIRWRKEVDAQMPLPNPKYDPAAKKPAATGTG